MENNSIDAFRSINCIKYDTLHRFNKNWSKNYLMLFDCKQGINTREFQTACISMHVFSIKDVKTLFVNRFFLIPARKIQSFPFNKGLKSSDPGNKDVSVISLWLN